MTILWYIKFLFLKKKIKEGETEKGRFISGKVTNKYKFDYLTFQLFDISPIKGTWYGEVNCSHTESSGHQTFQHTGLLCDKLL